MFVASDFYVLSYAWTVAGFVMCSDRLGHVCSVWRQRVPQVVQAALGAFCEM